MTETSVLETLIAQERLTEEVALEVSARARERNVSIEQVLPEFGITAEELLTLKSGDSGVPVRVLPDDFQVPFNILSYIPEESASHYKMVPLTVTDGVLEVGMVDPKDIEAIDALNFLTRRAGLPFKLFLVSRDDFERVIKMYHSLGGEVGQALYELESEMSSEEQKIQEAINEQEQTGGTFIKEDAPVIKIVATILRYAVDGRASDIHIEPTDNNVKVRFRVDGILHTSLTLPPKVLRAVVARIKVLSSMRLDESRKPQDGRFSATVGGHKIDFRVSTFPSYNGEKIVMRILDRERGFITLTDLGMSERNLKFIRAAIEKPHGLILISGPTGSGKSTTLYSMLSEVDRETKNVLSLEDPVEYHVPGVNQSQVRPEIGYTFATGLRTTLRQDPDVIMVGEIRDSETAKLAVQAALTGHLVLSTIHTNSSVGVIPRLVDMGVDPYLIAPTLVLSMAQRLVQKLCPNGGESVPIDESSRTMIQESFATLPPEYQPKIPDSVLEPKSTPDCPAGVRGRMAVFEVMPITEQIKHAILTDPTEERISELARKDGMYTMVEDAMLKAFDGKIPFSEVHTLGGTLLSETSDIVTAVQTAAPASQSTIADTSAPAQPTV
jgi:type IV pilus assembly protein PilB